MTETQWDRDRDRDKDTDTDTDRERNRGSLAWVGTSEPACTLKLTPERTSGSEGS
eukprot:COSAG03_NODE_2424_length_2785_cov_6.635890_4_plen_55_part_00